MKLLPFFIFTYSNFLSKISKSSLLNPDKLKNVCPLLIIVFISPSLTQALLLFVALARLQWSSRVFLIERVFEVEVYSTWPWCWPDTDPFDQVDYLDAEWRGVRLVYPPSPSSACRPAGSTVTLEADRCCLWIRIILIPRHVECKDFGRIRQRLCNVNVIRNASPNPT